MLLQFLHIIDKKILYLKWFFLKFIVIFLHSPCWAVSFSTSYVSLEIPQNWTCFPSNVTWVCHSKNKSKAAEYVIILTAKETGQQDNISEYLNYLEKKKVPVESSVKKNPQPSKVFHAKKHDISAHPWADGFHRGSEYRKYYTRYLATTNKNIIAVLVTYTVHKEKWKLYSAEVLKSIKSLKLLSVEETLRKIRSGNPAVDNARIQNYLAGILGDGEIDFEDENSTSGGFLNFLKRNPLEVALGGGIGGGLLYFLHKLKRRKKSPSSRPKRRRRRR